MDDLLVRIGWGDPQQQIHGARQHKCHLVVKSDSDTEVEKGIARFLKTLLAEHLGCSLEILERIMKQEGSL